MNKATKSTEDNLKQEILKKSIASKFPSCTRPETKLKIYVPLPNFSSVEKQPDSDAERFYIDLVAHTMAIEEAEKVFNILKENHKLQKITKDEYKEGIIFGNSTGYHDFNKEMFIFNPYLEDYKYYAVDDHIQLSVDVQVINNGSIDINTRKKFNQRYYAETELKISVG